MAGRSGQFLDADDRLAVELEAMLKMVTPLPIQCCTCIYKVPLNLRSTKEAAYTPKVVSIGPLHHSEEKLAEMEVHKRRYLKSCLSRNTNITLNDCVSKLRGLEENVRNNYFEDQFSHRFSSDQFVTMMLLDSFFIIELFILNHSKKRIESDPVFHVESIYLSVYEDLLLLENQLPYFLLEDLYNFIHQSKEIDGCRYAGVSFFDLLVDFFGREIAQTFGSDSSYASPAYKPKHFVDYFLNSYMPSPGPICSTSPGYKSTHFLNYFPNFYLTVSPQDDDTRKTISLPSATLIHESGITIKKGANGCFLDITFSKDGVLEIPTLHIQDTTEDRLRNLLAMEQCRTDSSYYITEYVVLMHFLINTPSDVALLRSCGVIDNWLGSDEKACQLVDNIGKGVITDITSSRYYELFEKVNAYCNTPWNWWRAKLRSEYFSSPWSVLSLIAAVVVLICTLIQTVCSFLSL